MDDTDSEMPSRLDKPDDGAGGVALGQTGRLQLMANLAKGQFLLFLMS